MLGGFFRILRKQSNPAVSSLPSGLSEAVARANVVNRLLHRRHMRSRVPPGEDGGN